MSSAENKINLAWLRERLKRHFSELLRLAVPAIMTRIGLFGLAMVDIAMVGHYATQHLAWLNLANQSVIMFTLVVGMGLLAGVTVYTANAIGMDDYHGAGKVWKRNLSFTFLISLFLVAACLPAPLWLELLGQSQTDSETSGFLVRILAIGLPGHLLFFCCTSFLEGIKRAEVGFYMMIAANIVNVVFNYALIFGHFGFPELGAEGSAWASTIVRWFMAASVFGYIWFMPSIKDKYQIREKVTQKWAEWSDQRQMGYASAVSLAAEVLAFSALAVFAGWLGTVPLAAHGVIYQVIGIPLMIAIGIGVATTVRVGIAFSRKDKADTVLASISGIILNFIVCGAFSAAIYAFPAPLLGIFTNDIRIIELLIPVIFVATFGMIFDAAQMVAAMMLRGFKETWWPTYLQSFSFIAVMLPACYIFTFPLEMGFKGLMVGTFVGVVVSWILQIARFVYLVRQPATMQTE
ncbi:MATE family efflux transporter [Kordiimonas sp. SCSIO 12603]|uniref:MATE family efflux transporter n=1 Tax=Kordiimonas sp. SCSIO 12603 TaxID=2829596 RepID=UPI0021067244|nr:MATE family efflux transporter [Kordiimonas sp. SCSIO 12603]UTW59362.1 MATE family efflux transporter [Kordiimonas sp. SCSIO 12603]